MAAIIFETDYLSVHGVSYTVKIHDYSGSGDSSTMNISPDIYITGHGNDRDIFDIIKTASAGISIAIDSDDTSAFFTSIKGAAEGQYYMEILTDTTRRFMGRILGNGLSIEDEGRAFFNIEAIDGLTLLKNIKYTHPAPGTQSLKDIFCHILSQIDVVDKYYSSGVLLVTNTNLRTDNSRYGTLPYILELTRHHDYFFKTNNNVKEYYTCWEVLEDILRHYGLRMFYENGAYYVVGLETYLDSTDFSWRSYDKEGTVVGFPIVVLPTDINVEGNSRTTAAGQHYFAPGIKSIRLEVDKEYNTIPRNLAEGLSWRRTDTGFKLINPIRGEVDYKSLMRVNMNNSFTATQLGDVRYVKIRFTWKIQVQPSGTIDYPRYVRNANPLLTYGNAYSGMSTSDLYMPLGTLQDAVELTNNASEDYTEVIFRYVPQIDYWIEWLFPQYDENRDISFKATFVSLLDSTYAEISQPIVSMFYDYKITHELGTSPLLTVQDIVFTAENDSEDVIKKKYTILASDQYGTTLPKPIFWTGSFSELASDSGDSWSYDGVTYGPLERMMLTQMMRFADKQQYYQGEVNYVTAFPSFRNPIIYRDDTFILAKRTWRLYTDEIDVSIIKISESPHTTTVDAETPVQDNYFPFTQYIEQVSIRPGNPAERYFYRETGVTDTYVIIPDALGYYITVDTDVDQIRDEWSVYQNGILQDYVDFNALTFPLTPGDILPGQYTVDPDADTFHFGYCENDTIIIKYIKV